MGYYVESEMLSTSQEYKDVGLSEIATMCSLHTSVMEKDSHVSDNLHSSYWKLRDTKIYLK